MIWCYSINLFKSIVLTHTRLILKEPSTIRIVIMKLSNTSIYARNEQLFNSNCTQGNIRPRFNSTLFVLMSAGEVKTGQIPKSQLLLFKHKFVWANSKRGEIKTSAEDIEQTQYKMKLTYIEN